MNRKEVLKMCRTARTLAEVKAAQEARGLYLVQHPDDGEIFHMGEMLSMLEDAINIVGEVEPAPFPTVEDLVKKAS